MTGERLKKIYKKTDGNCHICHGRLTYYNYSRPGTNGAWEVEHSKPKYKGGSDNFNNLYPAHIGCNREKGIMSSKTARSIYGNGRAPHSKATKVRIRNENMTIGAVAGFVVGGALGPVGRIVAAGIGALIADEFSPRK